MSFLRKPFEWRAVPVLSSLLFTALTSGVGAAQTGAESVSEVTFVLTEPGASLRVPSASDPGALEPCNGHCTVWLAPGSHSIYVTDSEGRWSSGSVTVTGPSRVEVAPPDVTARNIGIGVAIGGAAAFTVGGPLFLYGAVSRLSTMECVDDCDVAPRWILLTGLGAMGVGAVAAVAGLILILQNDEPSFSTTRLQPAAARLQRPGPTLISTGRLDPPPPVFTLALAL